MPTQRNSGVLVLQQLRRLHIENLHAPPMNRGRAVSRICLPDLLGRANPEASFFEYLALHAL